MTLLFWPRFELSREPLSSGLRHVYTLKGKPSLDELYHLIHSVWKQKSLSLLFSHLHHLGNYAKNVGMM